MKKILLMFILIFLVSGCGAKYELRIKKDSIEENINFDVIKSGIYDTDEYYDSDYFKEDLINKDVNVFIDEPSCSDCYYEKEVNQDGSIYNINLSYKYKDDTLIKARTINECFEKKDIKFQNNRVYIHLSGQFYCLYDEPIEIYIKSDFKIKSANGIKSGSGYKWTIDESNYNNVDIEIESTKTSKIRYYIYIVIAVIVGIGLTLFLMYFIGNIMGRNNVNDI